MAQMANDKALENRMIINALEQGSICCCNLKVGLLFFFVLNIVFASGSALWNIWALVNQPTVSPTTSHTYIIFSMILNIFMVMASVFGIIAVFKGKRSHFIPVKIMYIISIVLRIISIVFCIISIVGILLVWLPVTGLIICIVIYNGINRAIDIITAVKQSRHIIAANTGPTRVVVV